MFVLVRYVEEEVALALASKQFISGGGGGGGT